MALSLDMCPMMKPGVRVEKLPLSPVEGFIMSRVNGLTPVRDIISATGLPQAQVEDALKKLESLDVIEWQRIEAAAPRARTGAAAMPKGEVKAPQGPDLNHILERVALMHRSLNRIDYYKLLSIPRTADDETIKSAYAQLSREIHPDRFYNMNLGERKDLLDTVFAKISIAYETLRDPTKRAAYDYSLLPPELRKSVPDQQTKKLGVTADASRIAELAEQELRNGNYKTAAQNFKIAASLSLGDRELAKRAAFVVGLPALTANLEKIMGDPEGATLLGDKSMKSLVTKIRADKDQFPMDDRLLSVVVGFLLYFDDDKSVAREIAEKLVRRAPRASYYVLLARVAEAERKYQEALKHFERALALDDSCVEAKEAVTALKRKF
jgi:curved DNA-binding protein CbpA